jgi:hypothetical protein
MLRIILIIMLALPTVNATPASADLGKRWIGILAVEESPLVNITIRESGGDPAVYGPRLRALLDAGQISPAVGRYCFVPYRNGRAYESEECSYIRSGVYTMWAPAEFVSEGRAMCVRVPHNWLAIAGQVRYPRRGGGHVECRDFGQEASDRFAETRHTAAMLVVVQAAN